MEGMRKRGHRFFIAAPALLGAVVLAAAPAIGQDATKPAPCGVPSITDKAGDATDPTVFGKSPDNMDITKGFFLTDAKGVTTANIEVVNLDKTVPADSTATHWRMLWQDPAGTGTEFYVSAYLF